MNPTCEAMWSCLSQCIHVWCQVSRADVDILGQELRHMVFFVARKTLQEVKAELLTTEVGKSEDVM